MTTDIPTSPTMKTSKNKLTIWFAGAFALACLTQSALALDPPIPGVSLGSNNLNPTLEWSRVDDAEWYRVWVSTAGNTTENLLFSDEFTNSYWVEGVDNTELELTADTFPEGVDSLSPGEHVWWVLAFNSTDGSSAWSTGQPFTARKVSYKSYSAPAFEGEISDDLELNTFLDTWAETTGGLTDVHCSIEIPHGATWLSVTLFYADLDADKTVFITQNPLVGTIKANSAEAEAGETSVTIDGLDSALASEIDPTVDNENNSYLLSILNVGNGAKFFSVRIEYLEPLIP